MMDANLASATPKPPEEIMKEALIVSALESAEKAVALGLPEDKIILSCKVSAVQDLIQVYRELGSRCRYPLHLGLTEAGMGSKGIVASTAALAVLLQEGIGDTIRISLTPEPGLPAYTRSHCRSGNPANHGLALLYANGYSLPGLRPHHQYRIPRVGSRRTKLFTPKNGCLAH